MKKYLILLLTSISLLACSTNKSLTTQIISQNNFDRALADSILAYALDHEALFTLADTLKPISSVKFLRFAIAKDSSQKDGDIIITTKDSLLQKIDAYQQACNALSKGDWQFILMPFQRTEKSMRNMEIYVVRKSVFAKKIVQYQSFFGQWGFTAHTNAAVVIPVIEYESKWDRNRAYGYLFGYPEYAVDFFVEANKMQESDPNKKMVGRNFFAIPVYAGNQGFFTYAMPKTYQPNNVDSSIYKNAANTLNKYKVIREKYISTAGLKALDLWEAILRK
jgi:hypothetical protein